MMESAIVFVLVLVGTGLGWVLGYRSGKVRPKNTPADWIPSIDFILAQNTDITLKRLVNAQTLDDDSIELFLRLGCSLREKGEVERAIHLHQTLFARTDLKGVLLQELELELAMDFAMAGLHDRAERLLLELLDARGRIQEKSAKVLLELLEEEGAWQQVLDLNRARKLPNSALLQRRVAHAACELAERAAASGNYIETRQLCRTALKSDGRCARAFVVLGNMAFEQDEPSEAVRCYLKALDHDPGSIIAILDPMVRSFHQLGDPHGLLAHLQRHGEGLNYVPALVARAETLADIEGAETAITGFIQDLEKYPSYTGYVAMLGLLLRHKRRLSESQAHGVYAILRRIDTDDPSFVCSQCGFKAREFHWRCPSCKNWASLKAITPFSHPSVAIEDL
jgi:lipopolysaccharide biosynthesis regulator YciM